MQIRNFTLEKPIIQGGMGIGVSLGNLAGNVAKCGGMGIISTVNAGYREPDFNKFPVEANLRALKQEIEKAKNISEGNGIVGINIMVAVNHYQETVKTAVEAGVQAIISGAGLPTDLPSYVGDADVAIAPIVSSGKAASLICRNWDKKYSRIPDFIVIEGPKAGGHLGYKKEEILSGTAKSPFETLPEVKEAVKEYEDKYNKSIPIFIGGGIFDAEDVKKALDSGADGVQIGTRFIATKECDASQTYKDMIINAKEEDAVIVVSPVGLPGRALRTTLIENLDNGVKLNPEICNDCLKACPHGKNAPYCISRALVAAVTGDVENGLFFCGSNVGRVDKMTTVEELLNELLSCPG